MHEFLDVVAKISNILLFGALRILLPFNKNKHTEKPIYIDLKVSYMYNL